ncbi:MAG: class II aldolase/adducin family protein [Acidobacteriota bacterium]
MDEKVIVDGAVGEVDEGVIKYQLDWTTGPAPQVDAWRELSGWRQVLRALAVLGRDPGRYGGYGFGNISRRVVTRESEETAFVITGTQTGGRARLTPEDWTLVTHCDSAVNRIVAHGPIAPSSEALTHGAVYALSREIGAVFHVHAPELWRAADRLGLPATAGDVAYGTPAMAAEVARLTVEVDLLTERIFVMNGHEDGVIAFGATPDAAGAVLVAHLARAARSNA